MRIVTGMVIGGIRSGKSGIAEDIFTDLIGGSSSEAVYIATGPSPQMDDSWAKRIAAHRDRRPPSWSTVEVGDLGDLSLSLEVQELPVIVDSLTILATPSDAEMSNIWPSEAISPDVAPSVLSPPTTILSEVAPLTATPTTTPSAAKEPTFHLNDWSKNLDRLERSLAKRREAGLISIFVADEVGLSVHPTTKIGIEFQDRAGMLNSTIAALCDTVWFVVAGRAVEMDRIGKPCST
jgi:adenosylcobinamide kinase/adenosylcobinamide-phosphate guanylyltransferase